MSTPADNKQCTHCNKPAHEIPEEKNLRLKKLLEVISKLDPTETLYVQMQRCKLGFYRSKNGSWDVLLTPCEYIHHKSVLPNCDIPYFHRSSFNITDPLCITHYTAGRILEINLIILNPYSD